MGETTGMTGIEAIAIERAHQEQMWPAEHDDEYKDGQLLNAARCYVAAAQYVRIFPSTVMPVWVRDAAAPWPWDEEWWKPSADPVRNLEKAGALLAAEIDRVQRSTDG